MHRSRNENGSEHTTLTLMSLSMLYAYMFSMMASSTLGLLPVFGGALFMCSRLSAVIMEFLRGRYRRVLTKGMRVTGITLLCVMLVCVLLLLFVYPIAVDSARAWAMFAIVLCYTFRSGMARRLVRRRLRTAWLVPLMALTQLVPCGVILWLLSGLLPVRDALLMVAGFAASSLLEGYTLWRERRWLAEPESETADAEEICEVSAELKNVHAYTSYQMLYSLVLLALQVTLVMAYTLIGVTTEAMITGLLVAAGCTLIMREATEFILRRFVKKPPFVTQAMLVGLFLWLYGLVLLYRQPRLQPSLLLSYFSIALCSGGLTIAVSCLAALEKRMVDVATYAVGDHLRSYRQMRAASSELAIAVVQMIARGLLTLLTMASSPAPASLSEVWAAVSASFRPLLIAPALLLLLAAILSVLHFPMNMRHFQKLSRFLSLEEQGEPNPSLKKQLDEVVVRRHKNRYGVRLILALLRPLYYHKVIGTENLSQYEDGTIILVSNHGELYGPVVTNLYIPISFRPWSISEIVDKDAIVPYVYENTALRQKWCPDFLKMPLTKLCCRFILWVLSSIEAIPVYRSKPRELLKTFRISVEAMQAGDNLLIFPENPQLNEGDDKRYRREGISAFYTGFVMLAPALYAKAKKRAVFVPIYASKHLRTLTIGAGIRYDPEPPQTEEKLRIVGELQRSMQAMYEAEKAQLAAKAGPTSDRHTPNT